MQRLLLPLAALSMVACALGDGQEPERRLGDEQEQDDDTPAPCVYPEAGTLDGVGSIMPNVRWAEAIQPDGTTLDFSLEDFRCNPAWDSYDSVTFIIVAEWCPNCPDYLNMVEAAAADLEDAGSFLVILDLEDRDYALPSNESAHQYVSSKIGDSVGLRVGDGDADPKGLIYGSPIWSAVPGAWIARRDDSRVIVNQEDWETVLNWPLVAAHLDADWSDPRNPPYFSNCAEGDDETSEPNDVPSSAALIAVGTTNGGICSDAPDYFQVGVTGAWQLDLEFNGDIADLDIYVVNPDTGEPLMENGAAVGSEGYTGLESFSYAGAATVKVIGFSGSSAPYTLTLTEL